MKIGETESRQVGSEVRCSRRVGWGVGYVELYYAPGILNGQWRHETYRR